MQAPYLKIENNPIEIGQKYYTVNHFAPHLVKEHIAGNENNVANKHYRFNQSDALELSELLTIYGKLQSACNAMERVINDKCFDGTFVIKIGN